MRRAACGGLIACVVLAAVCTPGLAVACSIAVATPESERAAEIARAPRERKRVAELVGRSDVVFLARVVKGQAFERPQRISLLVPVRALKGRAPSYLALRQRYVGQGSACGPDFVPEFDFAAGFVGAEVLVFAERRTLALGGASLPLPGLKVIEVTDARSTLGARLVGAFKLPPLKAGRLPFNEAR